MARGHSNVGPKYFNAAVNKDLKSTRGISVVIINSNDDDDDDDDDDDADDDHGDDA